MAMVMVTAITAGMAIAGITTAGIADAAIGIIIIDDAGRTFVWPYDVNGRAMIRCFIQGSMT